MLVTVVVGAIAFVVGAAIGVHNVSNVNAAIAILKQAEQRAKATLDQITAHKAS